MAGGGSQKQAKVDIPPAARGTVLPHSGETRASGHGPAQKLMDTLKSHEEIASMGVAEVIAYEDHLRALRITLLQRIKEEEKQAAGAEQPTPPEPRRRF